METHNFLIPNRGIESLMAILEGGHQTVWRSKTCKCKRHTWRGVRGKDSDVLVDERLINTPDEYDTIRLEVSKKEGRYDNAVRDRYVFRMVTPHDQQQMTIAEFIAEEHPGSLVIRVVDPITTYVDVSYRRLISEIDRSNEVSLARMLTAHAYGIDGVGGYFKHLDSSIVDSCAGEFVAAVIAHPEWTKAEAYQCAGRILYRESKNSGYRKLTLREKSKLGIDPSTGQWWKEEDIYSATGCGEATLSGVW